ncbi:Uma2 family endonuclease [Pannus brasiliensis CCIBt3594]|uniref:Uma2 family endonuclease n=1 Tax=Pannus brasiliensis CCIBt3594 TaxID=1427578 RepID=A0AAW9QPJ2_9CHRO
MTIALPKETFTLEDFIADPPEGKEWVNGLLVEKIGMTVKHSKFKSRICRLWGNYAEESGQGGEFYVELACVTLRQGRRPDVCYLTPELAAEYSDRATIPQSPPSIAEIVSPTDSAEDLFAKADEYLASGGEEVWLILPESQRVFIVTRERTLAFQGPDEVSARVILPGFRVSLRDLFA